MKRYTEEHEWVELKDGEAVVGISIHAAHELGDITFVELPEVGSTFDQGDAAATVESVKAAAEVYAPIGGTVSEVNSSLEDSPETVNDGPEAAGWLFKLRDVKESDLASLMSAADYDEFANG